MKYLILLTGASLSLGVNAACPPVPDWAKASNLNGSFDANCNFTVDGVSFDGRQSLYNMTREGTSSPDFRSYSEIASKCGLANAIYSNVQRLNATAGQDLINPGAFSHIRHFVIKNSVLSGTRHLEGGHEDILQTHKAINGGGWLVIQDSVAKNADTNMFMSIGTGDKGFGNGPGDAYACPDTLGTGGILFQGLKVAPNDSGYTGSSQMSIGDPGSLPLKEVWLVDVDYTGLGINFSDTVGKIVVVGGRGGNRGWPGPLKVRRLDGTVMTKATCPDNGWDDTNGWCCPNGQVNRKGEVFSWQKDNGAGDNPANGAIPVFCYKDIETALKAGHKEPVFLDWSNAGWSSKGWKPTSGLAGGIQVPVVPPTISSPIFSVAGGHYLSAQSVALKSSYTNQVVAIKYTTDGSDPVTKGKAYSAPINITASTVLKAAVILDGVASVVATEEYSIGSYQVDSGWNSLAFPQQTKNFLLSFKYVPAKSPQDVVIGLGSKPAGSYADLANIVRFAPEGIIDARDGSKYAIDRTFSYSAGRTYEIEVSVDLETKSYAVDVREDAGEAVRVAEAFLFRTEQANASVFTHLSYIALGEGGGEISDVKIGAIKAPPKKIDANTLRLEVLK